MVPKVAGKGRSFVGAGLYYLHDKKAETSERVAFTHTVNLPTRDADKAIRLMAYTAMHQSEIKARAGGSTRGRKLADPVYCYSLSWAPGEEPSQEEMIDAAQETLKALGLEGHEALLVGHNDEPHPHIHVIVNRVNPETGIAAKLKMDHLKLSTWAEAFERKQGQIRCEQRALNNERRRNGEFVKDWSSQKAAEFQRWRMERAHRRSDRRVREGERLGAKHQGDRDRLRIDRDRLVTEQRKRFLDATRADWRDLYAIQRQERRRFTDAQRNAWSRVRFDIRTYGENYRKAGRGGRKDMLKGAASALVGSKAQKEKLELKQKKERLFFARKLKERADKLIIPIRRKHERDLTELHKKQERERHELQMKQSKESQAEARELKEGRDKEIFRKEQRGKLRHELTETKRDVTTPITPKEKASPSLADRFRKAQEKGVGDKSKDQFRDNANDIGKDAGRERNKKPPK
ncbi:relaxase/mobilization nuclease domain-containing protein [Afipia massiliensis]|nr:relaxase/mobilization nuclease domain-containing protein [Afipia massiliensis]